MRNKKIVIIALLILIPLINLPAVHSVEYVRQAESLEQNFPSLKAGNYYKYIKTMNTGNRKIQYSIKIEITNVVIEEKQFTVSYRVYNNGTLKHEESITCPYHELSIKLGELNVYNTSAAAYDELSKKYDKRYLTYYWVASTPIRALALEKSSNSYSERLLIDEGLGIILELDISNSSTTIKYKLVESNEIFPHLGAITFFGILIGIVIMSLVAYEVKTHKSQ
ncbi:MAG: hypothetical protein GSR79_04900 [Desulfurococcales archaeon]|nr:hypothetical protein [Desulfurococcales archaeon]